MVADPIFMMHCTDNFRVINAKDFWVLDLLVIKTFRADNHISVGELAEQLVIRDHSAAELVSRLVLGQSEALGFVRRRGQFYVCLPRRLGRTVGTFDSTI